MELTIKEGDYKPYVKAAFVTITDAAPLGTPFVLDGCSVKFIMRPRGEATAKVDATATIMDSTNGYVEYRWLAGDTDTPGEYIGEFEVNDTVGKITFFDTRSLDDINSGERVQHLTIKIVSDLG